MKKTEASVVEVKAESIEPTARERILAKYAESKTKKYIDLQANGTPFVLFEGKASPGNYLAQLTGFSYECGKSQDGKQLPDFVQVSFQWSGHATEKDQVFFIAEPDFPFVRGKLLSFAGTDDLDDALSALVETQTAVVLRVKYVQVKQG